MQFTGRPLLEDRSRYIIPVCAPYDAMQDYKYRVKLVPGTGKKGKIAQQALALFVKHDHASPAEVDLIKLIPSQDIMNILLANVKLTAPGLEGAGKKTKRKPTNKQPTADDD